MDGVYSTRHVHRKQGAFDVQEPADLGRYKQAPLEETAAGFTTFIGANGCIYGSIRLREITPCTVTKQIPPTHECSEVNGDNILAEVMASLFQPLCGVTEPLHTGSAIEKRRMHCTNIPSSLLQQFALARDADFDFS